jgi:hypothetical protein
VEQFVSSSSRNRKKEEEVFGRLTKEEESTPLKEEGE